MRRMRVWGKSVVFVIAGAALAAVSQTLSAPVAVADEQLVNLAEQCAVQYPDSNDFFSGVLYIVAPSNAYSWRCQQFSKQPGAGVIYNLGIDVQAYCDRYGTGRAVALNIDDPTSWRCRT